MSSSRDPASSLQYSYCELKVPEPNLAGFSHNESEYVTSQIIHTYEIDGEQISVLDETDGLNEDPFGVLQKSSGLEEDQFSVSQKTSGLEDDQFSVLQKSSGLEEDQFSVLQNTRGLDEDQFTVLQKTSGLNFNQTDCKYKSHRPYDLFIFILVPNQF